MDSRVGSQPLPEAAYAWAAKPTAQLPMIAPARAILATLIAEVLRAVRCS